MTDKPNGTVSVWKAVSGALITFIAGAAIPLFVTRGDLTAKDIVPIQKQLDQIVLIQATQTSEISALRADVSALAEHVKLEDKLKR